MRTLLVPRLMVAAGALLAPWAMRDALAQATGARPGAAAGMPGSEATGPRRHVDGRVVRQGDRVAVPVSHEWVTLHRVGSDTAGPIDSVRTDGSGHYAMEYRWWGAKNAVYFVSASYAGIAYFSQPLTESVERGAKADITVFDTTSHPIPLHVRGRHLIVSSPAASGLRTVVEVFELSNDTSATLVSSSASGDRPTWAMLLPAGAQQFRVGQGDVSEDAVTLVNGRAEVFAPFAPGLKQLSFSYSLPPSAFPLTRQLTARSSVLEVLLEERAARADGPGLRQVASVVVEGRPFRRYLAPDVPAASEVRLTVPAVLSDRRAMYIAVILTAMGAVMLGGLATAFMRRAPGGAVLAAPGSGR